MRLLGASKVQDLVPEMVSCSSDRPGNCILKGCLETGRAGELAPIGTQVVIYCTYSLTASLAWLRSREYTYLVNRFRTFLVFEEMGVMLVACNSARYAIRQPNR